MSSGFAFVVACIDTPSEIATGHDLRPAATTASCYTATAAATCFLVRVVPPNFPWNSSSIAFARAITEWIKLP
jgi:hypothetical protein